MRSLIITQFAPLPPDQAVDGVYKRLRMFVNGIATFSKTIEFLCLVPELDVQAYSNRADLDAIQSSYWGHAVHMKLVPTARRTETAWNHYGAGVFSISQQPGIYHFAGPTQVKAVRRELSSKPDLVFVFRLGAMAAVLRSGIYLPRMFFDLDDVEHRVRMRTALERPIWPGKVVYCSHVPAILSAEWRGARRSKATFVCSDGDARHLRRLGFGSKVLVIPNALPLPAPGVNSARPETLLYIGSFRYKPNRDGAERLLTKIWPLIRARNPSAKLIIAGKQPEQIPGFNDCLPGVEFTGFVSDLGALYARSRVVVCPLSMGGGTRMKLIEAASYSKPMVSTQIGAEGLDLTNGVDILLRDDDRSFAEACSRLLDDALLCAKLGNAARDKVTCLYDASRVQCRIADIMSG